MEKMVQYVALIRVPFLDRLAHLDLGDRGFTQSLPPHSRTSVR